MRCSVPFKKYVQREHKEPVSGALAQDKSYKEHKESMQWNESFRDKDEFLDKNFYMHKDDKNYFYELNLTTYDLAKKYFHGKTLSIGCGGAGVEMKLVEDGFELTASDLETSDFHDRLKELFLKSKFLPLNILEDEASGEKYDSIMAISITYLFDEASIDKMLQNIRSMLNDGGVALITLDISEPGFVSDYVLGDFFSFDTKLRNRYIQNKYKEKASLFYEQFFGYRRSDKCFIKKAQEFGFKLIEHKKTAFGNDLLSRLFVIERVRKYNYNLARLLSNALGRMFNMSYRRYFVLKLVR